MKFKIVNLGCKVNAYEAESTAFNLENKGYERTEDDNADIIIIYTCAVTNMAAQKSRKMIHRSLRNNPEAIIAVAGCYSQIDPDALKEANILIGTKNKTKIIDYIEKYQQTKKRIVDIENLDSLKFENMFIDRFESQTRAYLKIQDGCNQFCSYCVIPYARGRQRSMKPEDVYTSIKKLQTNHHEIVLSGIHTGRYGQEFGFSLTELIKEILNIVPEDFRLRISSIEMTEVTDELIDIMKNDNRIARHFHIPLQSGSDQVLRNMNRPYTTSDYLEKINDIRSKVKDISISTDLIVGFPDESEEDFKKTCDFLNECQFSFIHVFPYSVRKGTVAEKMKNQIRPEVKKERVSICSQISEKLYDNYKSTFINKNVSVLVENIKDGYSYGHSSEYLPIKIIGEYPHSSFQNVMINELNEHQLIGEVYEAK